MDMLHRPLKLMDRVRATMHVKRYSPRTEKTDCYWIRSFIRFHRVCHPASMGAPESKSNAGPTPKSRAVAMPVSESHSDNGDK